MSDGIPPLLLQGIDYFNAGEFFEAHEAWEEIWRDSDGQEKLSYQGLIQIAACFHQVQQGRYDGSRRLLERALKKFAEAERHFFSVDLKALAEAAGRVVDGLPAQSRGGHMSHVCEFPKIPPPKA